MILILNLNALNYTKKVNGMKHRKVLVKKNSEKGVLYSQKLLICMLKDALRHPSTCKSRTAEERYALVARVLAGESQKSVEISEGITSGVLSKWIKCYKINGYNGLNMKKGDIRMKKTIYKYN